MEWKFNRARVLVTALACGGLLMGLATSAHAAARTHGKLLHITKPGVGIKAAQSNNWFGYNQGTLEQGSKLFNAITGDWTVPTATQHTAGQDAASSDWIGIGGGCIDAGCNLTDATLIQTGTEQDVDSSGKASYSAWWELIPAPSLTISNMTVSPGDHMHADIHETVSGANVWSITLEDVTRNETFTQTVPYPSTHATAEWIEETPLLIGTSPGLSALPNLSNVPFDLGTANGANPQLTRAEEIDLATQSGKVYAVPSAPDKDTDGGGLCAWATTAPRTP